MVHRIYSVDEEEEKSPLPEKSRRRRVSVKSEDTHGGFVSKRPRIHFPHQEGDDDDPMEEPSPLGLKLKKSPSLLDLIQMRLSQQQDKTPCSMAKTLATKEKSTTTTTTTTTTTSGGAALDKLKASNFPASLLKIGSWEYKSRYEGDLVAKCYFAKHKLVWEVLDGGLKNKIEIQWSDIMAIKPTYHQDAQPETLDVVVGRQPLFFREINPQPRKHTLWQATTDFTSGQATIHRQHFLQFPPGSLQKHFEKLMQCDPRLRFLSQQPEIVLESPYFLSSNVLESPMVSMFGDSNECDHRIPSKANGRFGFSGFTDTTASVSGLSSSDIDNHDLLDSSTMEKPQGHNHSRSETFSIEDVSSKVNATCGLVLLNQIKLPGVHPSMSVGDLISTIGDCISEQMKSDNPNLAINDSQKMNILEEISQYLLNDSQPIAVSDENEESIMSRVNSLCCLLQKESDLPVLSVGRSHNHNQTAETSYAAAIEGTTSMSRKDSFGEFLLHLPRIASLPQFLNSVPEDQYSETLKR